MSVQLFRVLPEIALPHSGIKHAGGTHVTTQTIPDYPFMYWPNGIPCEPVNMYFLDIAHEVTGKSLTTYAAQLSHLVRYCGNKPVSIEKLTDANITELSEELQKERSHRHPLERARNDNTVRDILSRAIRFLLWYQNTFMLHARTPLIGEQNVSPQIIVRRIKNSQSTPKNRAGEYYYTHSAMPTSESREPKRPIAAPIIEDIQRCILNQSVPEERSVRFTQRYRNNFELMVAQLEYMRARRMFMIWMMLHTGLRPSEMVEMSVEDHKDILATKALKIPTKKRRKVKAPMRSFPIRLDAATVVSRYLISRTTYCDALKNAGVEAAPGNAFFITMEGVPIKKSSLEKDFERLVTLAGYKDVEACLSMFRHRFITHEVIAHLTEFIKNSGKSRQMMTDTDYESILKRIAAKTGHGSVKSLWHYIDLAWHELDVWGNTDKALARLHAADKLFTDLLELKFELDALGAKARLPKTFVQRHQQFIDRLGEILDTARENIEVQELHGRQPVDF